MSRVVLVTGGSRGIGLATARAFAAEGHRVAITYRTAPPADPDGLLCVACDVTDPDQVEAAFTTIEAELGPVEILVSNAGITHDGLLVRMGEEDFSSVVDTNLAGGYRVARRAATRMLRARGGRIIFLSSVVAHLGPPAQANSAA